MERYGLTQAEYDRRLALQGGRCYICGYKDRTKVLQVDHDHATHKVRELLCGYCNSALGYVMEDLRILRGMIKYLKDHEE